MGTEVPKTRSKPAPKIVEVFPRDGLQTLIHAPSQPITTAEKLEIIATVSKAGIGEIEITGFAHPRVIPPLADADAVARGASPVPGVTFRALAPNLRGAERAIAAGVKKLSCLIVASETYQRRNANMTVRQNVEHIHRMIALCRDAGVAVHVGIGCSFICPYEGITPARNLTGLIAEFVGDGVDDLTIADSIGMADPALVTDRVETILGAWPALRLGLHLHDASGMGLANVWAGWQAGVSVFETSVGGFGGGIAMPSSVAHMGNLATEDVVNLFQSMGLMREVDLDALLAVARGVEARMGRHGGSHLLRGGTLAEMLAKGRAGLASEERSADGTA